MSSQIIGRVPAKSLARRIGWLALVLFGSWALCLLAAFSPSDATRGLLFSPHSPFGFILPAAGNIVALVSALLFVVKGPQRLAMLVVSIAFAGLAAALAHPAAVAMAAGLSPLYAESASSLQWFIVFPFSLLFAPMPH